MFPQVIEEHNIDTINLAIQNAEQIVITCHVSPDGDAIGSSLALWGVLKSLGKKVVIITPDQVPISLQFLPNISEIKSYSCDKHLCDSIFAISDLIFCLDFNALSRVDKMSKVLQESSAMKVLIDHHLDPENFASIIISQPQISSTCLLLLFVLYQLNLVEHINQEAAEGIYAGMMTDTGNFTYNSEDPYIYIAIAELIKKGIRKEFIYKKLYNTNTEERLRLCGYALGNKMTIYPEHHAALIYLSKQELEQYNYQKGDTEGLVNIPLSIPGIVYSAFLREDEEYVKVSMRSTGDFPVNLICENYFNGGGHKNAAGGEYMDSITEAVHLFVSLLKENDKYFN